MAKEPAPKLIIVRPPNPAEEVTRLETACRARAERDGLPIRVYSAQLVATRQEEWGRKVQMLEARHAGALYRALHRERVVVVAFTAVWVRRDPRRDPPVKRAALRLKTFVEHKALHGLVRDGKAVDELFDRYIDWCRAVRCTGENDPRVLPLHVFETRRDWSLLGTPDADRDFTRSYGRPRHRRDEGGKAWSRAEHGAYHGGAALTVAGHTLAPGMHWDVAVKRGSALVCSADGAWRLSGRSPYVNVHPDGYVRATASSTRVWPRI